MAAKTIPDHAAPYIRTAKALGDVPQERQCLRCTTRFVSEGFGERICRRCKGLNAWRSAVSVTPGQSRRR